MAASSHGSGQNRKKVIILGDRAPLLEVTKKCITGCDYCFMKGIVRPDGHHVPIQALTPRIDWLTEYTNTRGICLSGGDPLLHPDLEAITQHILGKGLTISMVTSGMYGAREAANVNHVLSLYEQGDIDIEVSYHVGKNEDAHKWWLTELDARAPVRARSVAKKAASIQRDLWYVGVPLARPLEYLLELASRALSSGNMQWMITHAIPDQQSLVKTLQSMGESLTDKSALHKTCISWLSRPYLNSTVTLPRGITQEAFLELVEAVFQQVNQGFRLKTATYGDKNVNFKQHLEERYHDVAAHFAPFADARSYRQMVNYHPSSANLALQTRLWGQIGVEPASITYHENTYATHMITSPYRGCGAMNSRILASGVISLDSLHVSSTGEMTLEPLGCVTANHMLGNIDEMDDPRAVFSHVFNGVHAIRHVIMATKTYRATAPHERCHADPEYQAKDGYSCTGCQSDLACNICATGIVATAPRKTHHAVATELIPVIERELLNHA